MPAHFLWSSANKRPPESVEQPGSPNSRGSSSDARAAWQYKGAVSGPRQDRRAGPRNRTRRLRQPACRSEGRGAPARLRARLAVNAELVGLYWRLGRLILERQQADGWGSKVIERLSADLRAEFPDMKDLSRRNLLYMRAFAEA